MDYEKKYNEAMLRADEAVQKGCLDKDMFDIIFPPDESEDERIRKFLIDLVSTMNWRVDWPEEKVKEEKVKCIAWLEKQKINTEGDFGRGYDCGYQAGYAVAVNEMKPKVATATPDAEKQRELMPPVNVDPCDASWDAYYQRGLNKGYELGLDAGRKEQKPELVQHPPITFTFNSNASRDERLKAALLALLNSDLLKVKEGGYFTKQDLIEWVERIPKDKPAWSEEDDQLIGFIFDLLNDLSWRKDWAMSKEECLERLKSLRPSWKPSEEQMEALEYVIRDYIEDGCNATVNYLQEILDQIKKL